MRKTIKKYLVPSISLFILLSFTSIALARGANSRWIKKNPTPKPTTTARPTITATMQSSTPTTTASPTITTKPTVLPTSTATPTATATSTTNATMYITYYGWPDNDPAGNAIAYPKSDGYPVIHEGAGGTGTYDNPVTFAAKIGRFPIGTKIYVPYIKKYVILEDTCASCTTNWIDIWIEGNGQYNDKVISCEEYWTKNNVPVEINPSPNREVSTSPLFDSSTGVCKN